MADDIIKVACIMGKWHGGGVESVVMNYYRNIDRTKIQFDFFCDADSTRIPYDEIEKLNGRVIVIPPYQKMPKYFKTLVQEFKQGGYKIVHSHITAMSFFSLAAAKKAGVPVRIAHAHSTSSPHEWKKNIIKNLLRPLSKINATHYFACSEVAAKWLFGERTFRSNKITLLHNAIDLSRFSFNEKSREEIRKEFKIEKDTVVLGHIGRFMPQKNHEFLIDIFNEYHKLNKNSVLFLAGAGPLEGAVREKVSALGLSESVIFAGQRKDADKLYMAFDVFLLPSLYEGLAVVAVEAQASGVPVLASDQVSPETDLTETLKMLPLEKPEYWAEQINNCLTNEKLSRTAASESNAAKLRSRGYDIALEGSKLAEMYKAFYNL